MSSASHFGVTSMDGAYQPRGTRPGILTAVGVISIIVASLCLVAGLASGLWTLGMHRTARMVATMNSGTTFNASAGAPALNLPTPEEVEAEMAGQRASRQSRRSGLIELLHAIRPMSPEARAQIDGMLARHAERILPAPLLTASQVSTRDLQRQIELIGSLPPTEAGDAEGVFFQFKRTGRLEVFANRAVFKATDGSGSLRTIGLATAAEEDAAILSAAATATPVAAPGAMPAILPTANANRLFPSGLTGAQVQAISQKAQQASQNKLNAAQMATIDLTLQTQTPPLVQSQMAYAPIRIAMVHADGSATVGFSNGTLMLASDGTITQQLSNNVQGITLDPIALTLMIGEAIAAAALAIFLLFSGIMMLRNAPAAFAMHWIYALLKLPMAILGAIAFVWVMQDLMSGIGRMNGGDDGSSGMVIFAIVLAVTGALYPIVLMIVLSIPTVRGYYAAERVR